jgi:hypothetical protein
MKINTALLVALTWDMGIIGRSSATMAKSLLFSKQFIIAYLFAVPIVLLPARRREKMNKNQNISHYDICQSLHAMNDMGFAAAEARAKGNTYGQSRTYNAECYADKCTRRGRCLIAVFYARSKDNG